jgi:hypothetical protein
MNSSLESVAPIICSDFKLPAKPQLLFWLFFLLVCSPFPYLQIGISFADHVLFCDSNLGSCLAPMCCPHLRNPSTLFIYLFPVLGLNSGPTPWVTPPALFCEGFFQDRVSQTICPGWLPTEILLISASWVAKIIGVSQRHPSETLPL